MGVEADYMKKRKTFERLILAAVAASTLACSGPANPGQPTPSQTSGPTSITPIDQAKVAAARLNLKGDPILAGCQIDVSAKNDTLVLVGKVPNETSKSKAEELVRKVEGIKKVQNDLKIEIGTEPIPQ